MCRRGRVIVRREDASAGFGVVGPGGFVGGVARSGGQPRGATGVARAGAVPPSPGRRPSHPALSTRGSRSGASGPSAIGAAPTPTASSVGLPPGGPTRPDDRVRAARAPGRAGRGRPRLCAPLPAHARGLGPAAERHRPAAVRGGGPDLGAAGGRPPRRHEPGPGVDPGAARDAARRLRRALGQPRRRAGDRHRVRLGRGARRRPGRRWPRAATPSSGTGRPAGGACAPTARMPRGRRTPTTGVCAPGRPRPGPGFQAARVVVGPRLEAAHEVLFAAAGMRAEPARVSVGGAGRSCRTEPGVKASAVRVPKIVGQRLEDQHVDPAHGDAEHRTTAHLGKGGPPEGRGHMSDVQGQARAAA